VALVNENKQMQARARIILAPNLPDGQIPDETMVLTRALKPFAEYELYFYADGNGSYAFDPGEHNWIEPVPASGKGTFVHSTTFPMDFSEDDFTLLNSDLIFDMPNLPGGMILQEAFLACLAQQFATVQTFDIRVFLEAEDRQVGLFKTYAGNEPTRGDLEGGIKLEGILDSGSAYRVDVVLNDQTNSFTITAPSDTSVTEVHVPAEQWFPFRATDCR
jgi:hypothetical protein